MTSDSGRHALGTQTHVSRRRLLKGAAITIGGLTGAALVGCSTTPAKPAAGGTAAGQASASATPGAARSYPKGALVPVVQGNIKDGGTWNENISFTDPFGANGYDAHTSLDSQLWEHIGELGITPDPWTGELVANVVESWETPDPTTFVLKVRDGVHTHNKPPWNGRVFNADDLAFNVNRITATTADAEGIPKTAFQRANTFNGIKSIEVVDPSHLKITLTAAQGQFLSGFTEHRNFLMPKGVVEVGFKDWLKLAGTAAYSASGQSDVGETFTKVDNYWRKGEPHFDKLQYTVLPDPAARTSAFVTKQLTAYGSPSPQDVSNIQKARPDALYYQTPGYLWNNIRPQTKYGALGDFRVRKAVQLTLNYQDIAKTSFGDTATFFAGLANSYPEGWSSDKVQTMPGYNPSTKDKDIADAVKLMSAAGHDGGQGVDYQILVSPNSVPYQNNSLAMQAQLVKVFPQIKITVQPGQSASFQNLQSQRNFQAITYTVGALSAVSQEAYQEYHTKGARNYQNFFNADCDALLEKGIAAQSLDERKQIYDTFQQKFQNEWMPIWPLQIPPVTFLLQPNVANFDTTVGPFCEWIDWQRMGSLGFVS